MPPSKRKVPKTNTEFVFHMMEFSKSGPMMQLFIMDAIMKASNNVAEMPIEELRRQFEFSGAANFINPDAWHAAATELDNEIKKRIL